MIRARLLRFFARFVLPAAEITEKLTSGWGPGGQSVNKAVNCVFLTHVPTGISVKVHQSRDLNVNKGIAYKRLCEKVELHIKGPDVYLLADPWNPLGPLYDFCIACNNKRS